MGATSSKSTKKKLKNYVSWFEIPALNLKRAVNFYNQIYDIRMETMEMQDFSMAFFPADKGIGGALVVGQGCLPSETGTLVYLNGGKDLNEILEKVEKAGGRVVLEKTPIGKNSGFFALFIDTEGNKLALHSNN